MSSVLVVDDIAANRDLVASLVRHRGHRALEAADGAEALRLVRDHRPELVISDILMPTMDGFELVRRIREDPAIASTPVVFYTAHYHEREARSLARSCGVARVIVKPADPADILAALDETFSAKPPATSAAKPEPHFDREHLRLMSDKLSAKVAELEAVNARLTALTRLSADLASERDPAALVRAVCRHARDLLLAKHAFVYARAKEGRDRHYFAACGVEDAQLLPCPHPLAGPLGDAVGSRRPYRWSGAAVSATQLGLPAGFPGARSVLAVPIASLDAAYGWVCLVDKVGAGAFDAAEEDLLGALASLDIREVFFLTTADNSEVLYISPAFEQVWGRSCASVYAQPSSWMEAIHPDDRERIAAHREEGSDFEYQYRIVRDDGTQRWIHTRGFGIRDEGGRAYRTAGIAEDVTERVRLERDLRRSESALRRAQSMAGVAHVITRPDGSFERWSDSLPRLVGYEEQAMPTSTRAWMDLVDPDDREGFRDAAIRAARSGAREQLEYRLRRGDGEWIHIRQLMEPLRAADDGAGRWFSTLQDITDVRAAADAWRESDRRFSDMMANMQLASLMLDREARILYCNDYLLNLTGWSRDEVRGRDWFELFIPPAISVEVRRVFGDLIANLPAAWHHENEIVTRTGRARLIRWNNSVLRSPSGEIIGVASIGEDVTERRRAEAEIRHLNADLERRVVERTAELEAANKELEAFDYSISHDLRGPLNRIEGFARALGEDYADRLDDRAADYINRISASTGRMTQLVGDLLALSMVARGELNRSSVDIGEQATAIIEILRRSEPDRNVEVRIDRGLRANADPGLLRIVLENLLGNAWKFTSGTPSPRIDVGSDRRNGNTVYHVRDNGAGFEGAQASRLFAPFRRLHTADQFSGAGAPFHFTLEPPLDRTSGTPA